MDDFYQNMIEQAPLVALMHEYQRQASGPRIEEPTAQYELANKPRYDITGERYGNTLSDDMFYQKNPRAIDKHTPETYEYFANPKGNAGEGAYVRPTYDLPYLNAYSNIPTQPMLGRKKFVTEGGSGVVRGEDVWESLDAPQEVLNYYEALRNLNQIKGLSTDSAHDEKFGKVQKTQDPRYDAKYDNYTGALVDYGRLSGRQLSELAKMGVERPIMDEEDASADLMGLVNLYKRILGLK